MHAFTPGPRQTVDHAKHPTLGEGRAVYENGPAFFLPDVGEPVALRKIGLGGVSSAPRRSYLTAHALDGTVVELETTDREHGDHHFRRWSPLHGAGWLVSLGRKVDRACAMRFDPDEGKPFEFIVHSMCVGRPAYAAEIVKDMRRKNPGTKKRPPTPEEDTHWVTYGLADESVIAFRDGAPDTSTDVAPSAPIATSATPIAAASKFPPPNATRAEIDAWLKSQTATA